jgi:hypothetical protein
MTKKTEGKCEKCLTEKECGIYDCYNPVDQKNHLKLMCDDCVAGLVEDWFNPVKTGCW